MYLFRKFLAAAAILTALSGCLGDPHDAPPNILFVIMDDVGIDQLSTMGYGGASPPSTPNIDAAARAGVRFRNTWSMPECSPGRAAMLVGRYPLRTRIGQALGPNDLANSQLTPYDVTTPKLLRQAGYESALFGKFHLAGPNHNAAELGTPQELGWDHFHGWLEGVPASIDTTAGGIAAPGTYACGFVPGAQQAGGADFGACRYADSSCEELRRPGDAPGLACLARGGIFVPHSSCPQASGMTLEFNRQNAYYVSPLVINEAGTVQAVPLADARARGYRTTLETNAAIDWIRGRDPSRPWMATVSFTAAHTPVQPPPGNLRARHAAGEAFDCSNSAAQHPLTGQMIEALDKEFGRLLVETGLAQTLPDGSLQYDPKATRTTLVIVGDNGSFPGAVRVPFDPQRAKSTAYQSGVWVPLIVAGPQVAQPGRDVEAMVNTVDLFRLFGDLAGVDTVASVPRRIDAQPLLPYLLDPGQPSLRSDNFAQGSPNLQLFGGSNGPCVVGTTPGSCTQSPMSKGICEDNGGVWWGAGATDPSVPAQRRASGYGSCCEVVQTVYLQSQGSTLLQQMPSTTMALRTERYKLVRNGALTYVPSTNSCQELSTDELYEVDQAVPVPRLDREESNLMRLPLSAALQQVYADLLARLDAVLRSEPACPGDGNQDGMVDVTDVANAQHIAATWGRSSVYDLNLDGLTNQEDVQVIRGHLGACPK